MMDAKEHRKQALGDSGGKISMIMVWRCRDVAQSLSSPKLGSSGRLLPSNGVIAGSTEPS